MHEGYGHEKLYIAVKKTSRVSRQFSGYTVSNIYEASAVGAGEGGFLISLSMLSMHVGVIQHVNTLDL